MNTGDDTKRNRICIAVLAMGGQGGGVLASVGCNSERTGGIV